MNRRITTALLTGVMTLALSSGLWAAPKREHTPPPQVPDGWIVIEEDLWNQFGTEPDESFLDAHKAFFLGQNAEAADDIRDGVAFMRVEAARDTAKGDERLLKTIRHLDQLATDVEAGQVTSIRKLDHAFARADMALANHYHAISKAMWSKKESQAAARALGVSSRHAKRAIHWARTDVDKGMMDQLADVESMADMAATGKSLQADQMSKTMQNYGETLDKFLDEDAYGGPAQTN